MGTKLTLAQVRVILLLAAVLLIVLTYFLIFQKNMNRAAQYENQTVQEQQKVAYLTKLRTDADSLELYLERYTGLIDPFIQSFPVKLTQQQSVTLIYNMMVDCGIDIESIVPGTEAPFYYKGQILDSASAQSQAMEEYSQGEPMSEITVVNMNEMIGSLATYTINLSGSTKEIYDTLDWIRDNDEKMSVGNVNLQFDSSTGKLSGSISINFYCMLGNGVPYREPDTTIFTYGIDNVFGEFSGKSGDKD